MCSRLTAHLQTQLCVQAQSDVEAAKRQQAFFQQHLQELTIFKAKTSAALLQVSFLLSTPASCRFGFSC